MVLLYVALKLFQIFGFKFARNYDDIYGTSAIALRSRIPTLLETKMFIAWQHNEHHESLSRFFRPGYVFFQLHPCFHAIILSINDIKQKTNEQKKERKWSTM